MSSTKSVLFLDKVFLHGKKKEVITGAERFNLRLIAQLQEQQDLPIRLTVPAASSWEQDIQEIADRGQLEYLHLPSVIRMSWPNTVLTCLRLLPRRFDCLLLGNVGRNLIPSVKILLRAGCFSEVVLLAHREPTGLFEKLLRNVPVRIVAVNDIIAERFRRAGFSEAETYFGEIQPELFQPAINGKAADDGKVHFCVFGSLDSEWKGSDTAIEAFESLPEDVRSRVHLHLAGFSKDLPEVDRSLITPYNWIAQEKVSEFLQRMDVMIVPSRDTGIMKETFSQACVQGMLCGLPLIVNDLPVLTDKLIGEAPRRRVGANYAEANYAGGDSRDVGNASDLRAGFVFRSKEELISHICVMADKSEIRKELSSGSVRIAHERFVWKTEHFVNRFLFPSSLV